MLSVKARGAADTHFSSLWYDPTENQTQSTIFAGKRSNHKATKLTFYLISFFKILTTTTAQKSLVSIFAKIFI